MTYLTRISGYVGAETRRHGEKHYLDGSVRITRAGKTLVKARVIDRVAYAVSLRRSGKTLLVCCACPHFEDSFAPCKHVWAALLASQEQGHLAAPGGPPITRMMVDEELFFGFEDEDVSDSWLYLDSKENVVLPFTPRGGRVTRLPTPARRQLPTPRLPRQNWKNIFADLRGAGLAAESAYPTKVQDAEILYILDLAGTREGQGIVVDIRRRESRVNGGWKKPRPLSLTPRDIPRLQDSDDRRILSALIGGQTAANSWSGYYYDPVNRVSSSVRISVPLAEVVLPMLCKTGRCLMRMDEHDEEQAPLQWDAGARWTFHLEVRREASDSEYTVTGSLRRGEERMPLEEPVLLTAGGLIFTREKVARLDDSGAFAWITRLRGDGKISIPTQDTEQLLTELMTLPRRPPMELPEELRFEQSALAPAPSLKIRPGKEGGRVVDRLDAELSFDYDGAKVAWGSPAGDIVQSEKRRVILRDTMAEQKAVIRLRQLQFKLRPGWQGMAAHFELNPRHFAAAVRALLVEDWHVEAEGRLYRQPGAFRIEVTSRIDWFELRGNVAFDDQAVSLPELLAAMKRGESTVRLGDGTFGVLPEEWLGQYAGLLDLGTAVEDHLRFGRTQVGLLDALLAVQPQATCDEVFARARKQLLEFEGVHPEEEPHGFTGTLRDYQREGLGWIFFLQRFGFGGCLADDMGLGKTVQVLALLASRSGQRRGRDGKPSLVVAPRSLIFNWKQEAARFTPRLRLLDHTGMGRHGALEGLADRDVVLTTYGTLRRDAPLLTDLEFDYVILDEAQAVKNAGTQSAKAVRLLRADHRLALSGTPIENHVSELWSLFEFLNPGMLGTAAIFRAQWDSRGPMTDDSRALLARALKPFILRRTKAQVAKELPAKLEQTLYCEMDAKQRQLYDEMKEHFRLSLGRRLDQEGLNRSKIQILEALLRLRQASCHPGLLDPKRVGEPSAKLETLMARLEEVLDEGHKALVFSQFVSLLSIVRKRLDGGKITYAYLDGQTRERASQVERFQNDPDCRLFLISLKAGGLGLNLTAAEYVFLLDPWWNPAVEAQAIDRAHRIGQTRQVFAYRLVTRGTVEEKIVELQKSKRDLADAIIQADSSLIRDISREDLELLLS